MTVSEYFLSKGDFLMCVSEDVQNVRPNCCFSPQTPHFFPHLTKRGLD